jgi:hypothetical protein
MTTARRTKYNVHQRAARQARRLAHFAGRMQATRRRRWPHEARANTLARKGYAAAWFALEELFPQL